MSCCDFVTNCRKNFETELITNSTDIYLVRKWGKMIESCAFRARQHKIAASFWNLVSTILNACTIVSTSLTTGEAIAKIMESYHLVILGGISTISASLATFFNAGSKASLHSQTARTLENLRVHLIHCNKPEDFDIFSKNYTEAIKDAPFLPFFLKEHRAKPEYYMNSEILGDDIEVQGRYLDESTTINMDQLKWKVSLQHDPICVDLCSLPKKIIRCCMCIGSPRRRDTHDVAHDDAHNANAQEIQVVNVPVQV